MPFAAHARAVNPPSGIIVNWNNRPAPNVGAADSNFSYGPVQRVELLAAELARKQKHTLASVASAMNKAATQDLRAALVWPLVRDVLRTGPAPSARAEAAAALVDAWASAGGAASTPTWTAGSTLRAPPFSTPRGRGSPTRFSRRSSGRSPPVSPRSSRGATIPGRRDPRTSRAGTGTWTRTCGRFSADRFAARTRVATAAAGDPRPAARRCGTLSTTQLRGSSPCRAPIRLAGGPMRRPSGSGSCPASSGTRCAGRTARRSSR